MKIVIAERRRRGRAVWQVNLTDGQRVYRRTYHLSATIALIRVRSHLAAGHTPAFPSAVRDLWRAIEHEMQPTRPRARVAAD